MGEIIGGNSESLALLKTEVRTSTTSMTSVPKPFKFLKDSYPKLTDHYSSMEVSLAKVYKCRLYIETIG